MTDTDRTFDIDIAQLLGWRWEGDEGGIRHLRWHDAPGFAAMEAGGEVYPTSLLLRYSADAAAVRLVEDEIGRRGLQEKYIGELWREIDPDRLAAINASPSEAMAHDFIVRLCWLLLRATPEQRCVAALRAVGGREGE